MTRGGIQPHGGKPVAAAGSGLIQKNPSSSSKRTGKSSGPINEKAGSSTGMSKQEINLKIMQLDGQLSVQEKMVRDSMIKVPARISGVSTKKFRSHAQNFFQKITKIFVPTKFFSTLPEAYIFFLILVILSDFGQFDIPQFSLK